VCVCCVGAIDVFRCECVVSVCVCVCVVMFVVMAKLSMTWCLLRSLRNYASLMSYRKRSCMIPLKVRLR